MIESFSCIETKRLWSGRRSRKLPADIQARAIIKLAMIDAAETLDDLKLPPSNRLHELKDDRAGQHSISINMKWRICFRWNNGSAYDVEIVDYH
ncbi:type II toxin-antitoxin system RelE/ParE family toxin [Erythrobacter sp. NFXS35]|uniref:type II toxin-antitoxin system RelE/ParE family toxin n=1 Tax=unclassified Erythrobacter TaxID=2633097 RepID=UPI0025D63BA9|nr:type II toxin-antitoxin system RelE/ParE family toxin [Erythrobacter sp.]